GPRTLLDPADETDRTDPVSRDAFFYPSPASARRPEVRRPHDRLSWLAVPDRLLLTESDAPSDHEYDAVWRVKPPFGPFPRALSETYPLTAEVPERLDGAAQVAAAEGVASLADANPDSDLTLGHDDWAARALDAVPDRVETENLRHLGR
ncbi:tRNA-guanine(15) transglycosylase, partial [Halorubrum sp. E3]